MLIGQENSRAGVPLQLGVEAGRFLVLEGNRAQRRSPSPLTVSLGFTTRPRSIHSQRDNAEERPKQAGSRSFLPPQRRSDGAAPGVPANIRSHIISKTFAELESISL